MRSFYNTDKFFQKMKKKPALQQVLDNLTQYSADDIEALTGSHFPRWIKDQLLELRKRNGKTSEDIANEIAEKMIAASQRST